MNKVAHNKKTLLTALEKSLGVVTTACNKCGISRSTFYNYYRDDAEFKAKVDDLENIVLDFAESKLHEQIDDGNITGIIFYLKTKGKKRGYIERQEHEITDKTKENAIDLSQLTDAELKQYIELSTKIRSTKSGTS